MNTKNIERKKNEENIKLISVLFVFRFLFLKKNHSSPFF